MSYLDDLKGNALLSESFFSAPNPYADRESEIKTVKDTVVSEWEGILNEKEIVEVLSEIDVAQGFGQVVIRLSQGQAAVGAAAAAAAIGYLAGKAINKAMSYPECKKYGSAGLRNKCNNIIKKRKKLAVLKAKIGLCNNSKDPKSCKVKVNAKIQQTQEKLTRLGKIEGI